MIVGVVAASSSTSAGGATPTSAPSASTSASTTRASGCCPGSRNPFITVRGLDLFGFHMNSSWCSWLPSTGWARGPIFLLVVQVAAQASGAIAVYLLARDRLRRPVARRWPSASVSSSTPPTSTWSGSTSIPTRWRSRPSCSPTGRPGPSGGGWFAVAAVLAVACKEDVALAPRGVGRRSSPSGATAGSAPSWPPPRRLVVVRPGHQVDPPPINGITAFYDSFFGEFGRSPDRGGGTRASPIPGTAFDTATAARPHELLPDDVRAGGVPARRSPCPTLLIAGPMLAINVLSTFPYQREIRYHYVGPGAGRASSWPRWRRWPSWARTPAA